MTSGLLLLKKALLIMDKVSAATKLTVSGVGGVVVDDMVVGATKAAEFDTEKEKESVFAIRNGSLKYLIVILAVLFVIQYLFPQLIILILIMGGGFLSVEAYHAIVDFFVNHSDDIDEENLTDEEKIQSAVKTSIILNIEIVVIAMSMVQGYSLFYQIISVSIASILITYIVYAIVLGLVRTDDVGFAMMKNNKENTISYKIGNLLVSILPYVMKFLMYAGAYAMALVGGEILVHNIEYIHHFYENNFHNLSTYIFAPIVGVIAGFFINIALIFLGFIKKFFSKKSLS